MTARSRCGLAFVLAVTTAACQGNGGTAAMAANRRAGRAPSAQGGSASGGSPGTGGATGAGGSSAGGTRRDWRNEHRRDRGGTSRLGRLGRLRAAPGIRARAERAERAGHWRRGRQRGTRRRRRQRHRRRGRAGRLGRERHRRPRRRLGRAGSSRQLHRLGDAEQARQEPTPRRRQHLRRGGGDGAVRPSLHLHLGRPVRFADALHGVRQRLHRRREGLHQRLLLVGLLQHAPRHVRRLFHAGRGQALAGADPDVHLLRDPADGAGDLHQLRRRGRGGDAGRAQRRAHDPLLRRLALPAAADRAAEGAPAHRARLLGLRAPGRLADGAGRRRRQRQPDRLRRAPQHHRRDGAVPHLDGPQVRAERAGGAVVVGLERRQQHQQERRRHHRRQGGGRVSGGLRAEQRRLRRRRDQRPGRRLLPDRPGDQQAGGTRPTRRCPTTRRIWPG